MSPSSQSSPKHQRKKKRKKSRSSSSSSPVAPPETTKVTIKVQKPNSAADPVLVSFPGGVPVSDNNNASNIQFEWRKLHPKSIGGRVIEGKDISQNSNHNNMDAVTSCLYRATSQGVGYDDRRTKMCIGLYDKQTGQVTVHQVASKGTVFALQQHLVSYEETFPSDNSGSGSGVSQNLTQSLFTDFGSAKKRKVLKSQQANRVNVDTVVGSGKAMIDSIQGVGNDKDGKNIMSESNRRAIAQALVKKEEQQSDGTTTYATAGSAVSAALSGVEAAHEQARRSFLPPYNTNARTICEVYDFRGILGDDGWSSICRTIDACLYNKNNNNEDDNDDDGSNYGDFIEALTLGGSRSSQDGANSPPPSPSVQRDWSSSVLDCLRYANSKGVVDAARREKNSAAKLSSSAKHRLRCILLLQYLLRFYKRFHGAGGGGRRSRVVPGLEDESQPKWFGIPRSAALCLLRDFATEHYRDARKNNPLFLDDDDDNDKDGNDNKKRKYNNEINPDVQQYIMSPANKDRCLVHILLVYLLARGGPKSMKVDDMTPIVQDIGGSAGAGGMVDTKQLNGLLRMAGCTVATNNQIKRTKAYLTVPLTFPPPKRRGGKKGR